MRHRSLATGLLLAALAATAALGPAPAHAADTDSVRLGLQRWFDDLVAGPALGYAVAAEGTIAVAETAVGFEATLPPIRVDLAGAGILSIEPIRLTLTSDTDDALAVAWRLPEALSLYGVDGDSRIVLGTRQGTGSFVPSLGLMRQSRLSLGDIALLGVDGERRLTVGSLLLSTRTTEGDGGTLDIATDVAIEGIAAADSGDAALRVARLGYSGIVRDVRPASWRRLAESLNAEALPSPQSPPAALLSGFESQYSAAGLRFAVGDEPASLGEARLAMAGEGLDGGLADLSLTLSLSDGDWPPTFGLFAAREAALDLTLSGLPSDRLVEALVAALADAASPQPEMALTMLNMRLQEAMMTAGAELRIGALRLASDQAEMRLDGTITPTLASMWGVVADIRMTIAGLDALIADARGRPDDGMALQQLTLLQALGSAESDPAGRPTRRYALRISAAGEVLLNGADLLPMLVAATP